MSITSIMFVCYGVQEYKIHNADLLFKEDSTVDDLIDIVEVRAPLGPCFVNASSAPQQFVCLIKTADSLAIIATILTFTSTNFQYTSARCLFIRYPVSAWLPVRYIFWLLPTRSLLKCWLALAFSYHEKQRAPPCHKNSESMLPEAMQLDTLIVAMRFCERSCRCPWRCVLGRYCNVLYCIELYCHVEISWLSSFWSRAYKPMVDTESVEEEETLLVLIVGRHLCS